MKILFEKASQKRSTALRKYAKTSLEETLENSPGREGEVECCSAIDSSAEDFVLRGENGLHDLAEILSLVAGKSRRHRHQRELGER